MFDYASPPPFAPSPDAGSLPPTPVGPPASIPAMPTGMPPGPPPGVNGIPGASGAPAPPYPTLPGEVDPASLQYMNETQSDGTVLLRVKNPDGTPGPVVQIVKPPAPKKAGGK